MIKDREDIVMSWSGGKDSAFALHQLLQSNLYNVKYLLTNIYEPTMRVSMHGTPEALIENQAKSIGIPLKKIYIKEDSSSDYENQMKKMLLLLKEEGINKIAFGDIFLEDLKAYRESKLAEVSMIAIFPLWKRNTKSISHQFIKEGFRTVTCCINPSIVPPSFIGLDFDQNFLNNLPDSVDPCGENGEFHSFCYAGPIFNERIDFTINGSVEHIYEHNNERHPYLFAKITPSY
jgi:uncharacterized protein (TIGR00290 family)